MATFAEKEDCMLTTYQQPDSLSFLANLKDYVFGTAADHVKVTVSLTHEGTTKTVMEDTLFPYGGQVAVEDLAGLLEPYVRQYLSATLQFTVTEMDAGGEVTATTTSGAFTVLFSMADVGVTAQEFTAEHFLTIMNGPKLTAGGREERVYAYGTSSVTIQGWLADGTSITKTMNATATSGGVSAFFVSADRVVSLLGTTTDMLKEYLVKSGAREQRFIVGSDMVPPAPSLAFVNSFGCVEFLHCVGTHQKDSQYTRQSARFSGQLRNYRIVEERRFTANTGWLNTAMADWADELFRSMEVYIWLGDTIGKAVVVNDSKSVITNEDDDMPAFEFTYQYAQRIHNVLQHRHAGRIFDNTFDHTFN